MRLSVLRGKSTRTFGACASSMTPVSVVSAYFPGERKLKMTLTSRMRL